MTESKSLLSTTFSLKYYMEIEKKKITHVARFPNIVAALFIFDNLLKVLKKKKKEKKKSITKRDNLQDNLYCN